MIFFFLWTQIENSSVIYMNNVGDWLRDVHKRDSAGLTIHQAVCAIFARSAVGTRLIVLEKIPDLSGTWVQLQTVLAPPSWFSWRMGEKVHSIAWRRSVSPVRFPPPSSVTSHRRPLPHPLSAPTTGRVHLHKAQQPVALREVPSGQ